MIIKELNNKIKKFKSIGWAPLVVEEVVAVVVVDVSDVVADVSDEIVDWEDDSLEEVGLEDVDVSVAMLHPTWKAPGHLPSSWCKCTLLQNLWCWENR